MAKTRKLPKPTAKGVALKTVQGRFQPIREAQRMVESNGSLKNF